MDNCKCYIDAYFEIGRDYKVKDLCDYVGISRQAFYDILSGKSMPRVNVAKKISDFFTDLNPEESGWIIDDFWRWV